MMGFPDTCTIERALRSYDAYNAPLDDYQVLAEQVPCRFVEQTESILNPQTLERATVTLYLLLLPADTDIRTEATDGIADRISNITHRDGTTEAGVFRVISLATRRDTGGAARHISARLEQVRT